MTPPKPNGLPRDLRRQADKPAPPGYAAARSRDYRERRFPQLHGTTFAQARRLSTAKGGKRTSPATAVRRAATTPEHLPAAIESGAWISRFRESQALDWSRRHDLTIAEAEVRYGRPAGTIRREFASQRGRRRPTPSDREPVVVPVVTSRGEQPVLLRGSKVREVARRHRAEVRAFVNGHSDGSAIAKFAGKRVGGVALETNLDRLLALYVTGQIIYGLSP
jgi:hypothetical protein